MQAVAVSVQGHTDKLGRGSEGGGQLFTENDEISLHVCDSIENNKTLIENDHSCDAYHWYGHGILSISSPATSKSFNQKC
jgi:hypothetical protein